MRQPKEPANRSKSDQNILFLSEMIVYFRPTCAGWALLFLRTPLKPHPSKRAPSKNALL